MKAIEFDSGFFTSRYARQSASSACRGGVICNHHTLDYTCPLHLHDYYEMELVTTGTLSQSVNGAPVLSRTGDYVFMDLLAVQRIEKPAAPCALWTLSISPPEVDTSVASLLASSRFPLVGRLPPRALAEANLLARALHGAIAGKGPHANERTAALTSLFVVLLLEYGTPLEGPAEDTRAYHYIQKALLYLNQHFAQGVTLTSLACEIHISPCYLSDLFSKIVGCRFVEYLTRLRLEHARLLLRTGDMPVSEIATRCGFGSPSNFTRAHRRAFAVSPSAYRHPEE